MEETKTEVKKPELPKEDRKTRRIKAEKGVTLETLVNLFFTGRSALKEADGEEADALYVHYRDMWIAECKAFNKSKSRPFTLRGEAFKEQVDRILKIEEQTKKRKEEENKVKDYAHWMRRAKLWYKYPGRVFWYWFISWGNHEKETQLWKRFYVKHILNARD